MTYVITRIHLLQSSSLTRALKRLKLKQKIAIRLTWVSEKFSKVVDVLAEERSHRQDVSLRSLILQAQRGQLGAAQVVKGGPEIKKNLKLFNETTTSLPCILFVRKHIQSNLCTTASLGTPKLWLL